MRIGNGAAAGGGHALHHEHHFGVERLYLHDDVGLSLVVMNAPMEHADALAEAPRRELAENAGALAGGDRLDRMDAELGFAECARRSPGAKNSGASSSSRKYVAGRFGRAARARSRTHRSR